LCDLVIELVKLAGRGDLGSTYGAQEEAFVGAGVGSM
jgi:hypothetical protein